MNVVEEDISQRLRLQKIKYINNYFIKGIDQNELLSNKNKTVCTALNYIEHFLTLFFVVTICSSISDFASLIDIPKEIKAIIARTEKFKSVIKKKEQSTMK